MNHQAQVTALTYCDDMLLVGTQGGYLLIFNIHHKIHPRTRSSNSVTMRRSPLSSLPNSSRPLYASASKRRKSSQGLDYSLVAATHCCAQPVVSVHPIGQQGSLRCFSSPHSPILSTSASHPLNVLVLFAGETSAGETAKSRTYLYEMTRGSPLDSPLNSPQGTFGGCESSGSCHSLPVVGSLKRCSLQDLDILPELTLHRVTKGSVSYLPLQEKSS